MVKRDDSGDLCLTTADDSPVTNAQLSRLVRRAIVFRLRPAMDTLEQLKHNQDRIDKTLRQHMHQEEVDWAEMRGAVKATKWWVGAAAALVAVFVSAIVLIVNNPHLLRLLQGIE